MAPRTSKELNALQDTTNQPMARPPALANLPFFKTTSFPINETQGTATDASKILVGDFSECLIGMRTKFRLLRLVERYADALQIGFIAYLRTDIQLVHPQSFGMVVGIIAT